MLWINNNITLMSFFKYLLLISSCMVLFCCSKITDAIKEYQYTEPCMNGYYLVMRDSHYGLISSDGKEIIPSKYELIYFLTEDVVAAHLDLCWYFFEIGGKLIGQEYGPSDQDVEVLLSDVHNIQLDNMKSWEGIVEGFERFCERCAFEEASFTTMAMSCDSLRFVISQTEGQMSEVQRRRIKQAYRAYLERRRDL